MEQIDRICEAGDENFNRARSIWGDSISLIQDLVDLYNLLGGMVANITLPEELSARINLILRLKFLLGCLCQLPLGGITCLRGHLSDSLYYLRKAIELCAFAALIKRDPGLAQTWFDAVDDNESYRIYRTEFTQKKLYPDDHNLLIQVSHQVTADNYLLLF